MVTSNPVGGGRPWESTYNGGQDKAEAGRQTYVCAQDTWRKEFEDIWKLEMARERLISTSSLESVFVKKDRSFHEEDKEKQDYFAFKLFIF